MKTKREHFFSSQRAGQRGNAMIYVLIAIVLFAALSLTFGRQTDTSEAGDLDDSKADLFATQLIAYATAAKSSVDQMIFSGLQINALDFTLPSEATFNAAPTITKVFHPDGGGLNPGAPISGSLDTSVPAPAAGWYMGRFNNVGWTKTSADDVILTAYGIKKKVCEKINLRATGSTAIPKLTKSIKDVLIAGSIGGGTNDDLITDPAATPVCAACDHKPSLCVEDKNGGVYAYYTVIADQ